ncbi:MAG: ATP-binding protein [Methanomassiliicoccus sp.]|nr:ATP-binding protein [Methanomassiliicoccus sp.]
MGDFCNRELREKAKRRLEERQPVQERSAEDNVKLVEELSLHQEELNIQNEELKRIQLELEETKAKYFELYDLAPVGYITLTPNLIIKEANLAASFLLGMERKQLINKPLSRFVSPRSQESFYLHYRRLEQGKQVDTLPIVRNDGEKIQVRIESNIVNGRIDRGFRSIVTDVTEVNRVQQQVEEYSKKLERSNTELQQFAYIASHDLQEPLRMITSYLGLLNRKFGDGLDPMAKEYMSFINSGAVRMRELVQDILEYSRVDTQGNEFARVDMDRVMIAVLNALHIYIDETKTVISSESLPTVLGDEKQMGQLLTNLISNAIKFRRHDAVPRIIVSAVAAGNEFIFSVKDNGIGIDAQYADKLFKMFSRLHTRDEYPGTGIGLAITKKIVERHGGRIWFESEPGKGTTFFFTIPT